MSDPAIHVERISYTYNGHLAVNGISFEVARGEVLGFLGPNGAGKSTTIKMLTGQLAPLSGTVSILGMDVTARPAEVRARVGVCFEEKNLYLDMSARENLVFFASLFGSRNPDVNGLLSRVGLIDRADDRVKKYSKGMRQRLMIARALVNEPEVLFLDEPTDGLDPVSSRAIRDIVRAEAARGVAILLTTHDMMEADELSDRVAFINEGQLLALDAPESLKLKHGRRGVTVRRREGDVVRDEHIELDREDAGARLKAAVDADGVMTIHTEEATLESIFIQMTGRGLEA
jgi:ABC-2 type transport system ATP-binding protein